MYYSLRYIIYESAAAVSCTASRSWPALLLRRWLCVCVSSYRRGDKKKNIYNNNIILLYVRFRVYVFNEPEYMKYYYYAPSLSNKATTRKKAMLGPGGYGDFVSRIRFRPDVPDMDKWAAVIIVVQVVLLYSDFYESKNNRFFFHTFQRPTVFLNIFRVTVHRRSKVTLFFRSRL